MGERTAELRANQLLAAERGRESGLRLQRQGREVPLAEWGGQILAECEPLAAALDATHQCGDYSAALRDAQALLGRPADTPSARVLDKIETAHGHSFSAFSLSQSLAARDALMERPWQDDQQAQFEAMAQHSLSDQQAIEVADSLPFEEWRQRYLSPEGLLV